MHDICGDDVIIFIAYIIQDGCITKDSAIRCETTSSALEGTG